MPKERKKKEIKEKESPGLLLTPTLSGPGLEKGGMGVGRSVAPVSPSGKKRGRRGFLLRAGVAPRFQ